MSEKQYEMLYIAHPDLEDNIDVISSRVQGFITARKGEIESEEVWGKRKLAYPIGKNLYGIYVMVNFSLDPAQLAEIDRQLRLQEEVLRHLVIVRPKIKPAEEKSKKRAKPALKDQPKVAEVKDATPEKSETERMKELDKKLEEIIGADL
jgi:small subunit ribosomal protein S6